jgi:FAD:protein FMN transferase
MCSRGRESFLSRSRKGVRPFLLVGCALAATGLGAQQAPTLQRYDLSEPHMGTLARLAIYAPSEAEARDGARAAFDRIAALDAALSDYRSDSELMRLSARAGEGPVAVSADLLDVLVVSQRLAERTAGAFDVTCGALTRLWRGARRLNELPSRERIEAARLAGGYRAMAIDEAARTVTLARPGVRLDVGGIAKGYAVDAALEALRARGLSRALAALGGDVAVGDAPPGAAGWTVDIERLPIDDAPELGPLVLTRAAVSTAGDAEQWMTVNGVRYSHILDPRTGRPMTGRTSTTVVARTGIIADGLDTALAIVGSREGRAIVDDTPGAAAVWVVERPGQAPEVVRSRHWPAPAETAGRRTQ